MLALLAAIYASLGIAQVGVLALSRDFHDALSRELSLLVNVAPEDPPMRPKIRLDLPWVRRKANRRAQFFLGFLPGQALITSWAGSSRGTGPWDVVTTVLTALWAAYWWMVMTAGQSARAWSPPETTPRPWYLRAWFALTERVFLFRWAPASYLGPALGAHVARRFYGPSERVEEQPLEFAGLALSRALTLIPVVKLLLRPLFSVCSARLLVEHAATARLPVAGHRRRGGGRRGPRARPRGTDALGRRGALTDAVRGRRPAGADEGEERPGGLRGRPPVTPEPTGSDGGPRQHRQHLGRAVARRDRVGEERQHALPGRQRSRRPARPGAVAGLDDEPDRHGGAAMPSGHRMPLLAPSPHPDARPPGIGVHPSARVQHGVFVRVVGGPGVHQGANEGGLPAPGASWHDDGAPAHRDHAGVHEHLGPGEPRDRELQLALQDVERVCMAQAARDLLAIEANGEPDHRCWRPAGSDRPAPGTVRPERGVRHLVHQGEDQGRRAMRRGPARREALADRGEQAAVIHPDLERRRRRRQPRSTPALAADVGIRDAAHHTAPRTTATPADTGRHPRAAGLIRAR